MNAPAKTEKPKTKMQLFREDVFSDRMRDQMSLALPRHMNLDRMLRIIMTTVQRTPAILDCNRVTVLGAIMQATQLGLEPDSVMGHCYLVPFNRECQLIIGYKGFIELARRSGLVRSIRAHVVHRGDYFKYELGLTPQLKHIPADMMEFEAEEIRQQALAALGDTTVESSLVATYAVVDLKDGTQQFEVLTKSFIEKIKRSSRSSGNASSPWKLWEDQMWKKTSIKQVLKYVPLSPEDKLAQALSNDEQAWRLDGRDVVPMSAFDTDGLSAAPTVAADASRELADVLQQSEQSADVPPAGPPVPDAAETPKPAAKRRGRRQKAQPAAAAPAPQPAAGAPPVATAATPPAAATPEPPAPAPGSPAAVAAQTADAWDQIAEQKKAATQGGLFDGDAAPAADPDLENV